MYCTLDKYIWMMYEGWKDSILGSIIDCWRSQAGPGWKGGSCLYFFSLRGYVNSDIEFVRLLGIGTSGSVKFSKLRIWGRKLLCD